jgi:hypothetical protein
MGIVTVTFTLASSWTWGKLEAHDGTWASVVNVGWGTRLITTCFHHPSGIYRRTIGSELHAPTDAVTRVQIVMIRDA